MATSNTPIFSQSFTLDACTCSAANSSYTTVTNMVLLSTPGANGSEYTHISCMPIATVASAMQVQLFVYDGTSAYSIVSAPLMASYTLNQTTAIPQTVFTHQDGTTISEANPLRVATGQKLYAGIGASNTVRFVAERRDY